MSQRSIEERVRGFVIRAKFSNPELNHLVEDVTTINVDDVVQRVGEFKHDGAATPRDVEMVGVVLDAIERTKRIEERINPSNPDNRIARHQAAIQQASNSLQRSDLK